MLNISFFTFNAFEENTYLLYNEQKQCWIIDPGMYGLQEAKHMTEFLAEKRLLPQAIINTHAHIDHIFGVQALTDKYHIPFGMHEEELPVLQIASTAAAAFGFEMGPAPQPSFFIREGQPLQLGGDKLTVFHVPGHSPGSIAFYYPEGGWVVAGDTLFAGSIGRTDLPGGSYETLIAAIHKHLLTLPGESVVYPGHGPATTIENERAYNEYLKG